MSGPTTELSTAVVDAIAQVAAAALPRVAAAIPATPAAELGRLALPSADPRLPLRRQDPRVSAAKTALADLPSPLAERLLGALELTVAALDLPVPPLVDALPSASDGPRTVSIAFSSGTSELSIELSKVDAFVPGATDMVAHVVAELVGHPAVAPLLVGTGPDEAAIAASHGSRHLALSVAAAAIVLRPLWPAVTPPAIIGAALGVAAPLLRAASMPAAYADAVLAKRRASYLMPRHSNGRAVVTDHVFTLAEDPLSSTVDFSGNGLVAVVPSGIAVRSGLSSGAVSVSLRVVDAPPDPDLSFWDEVVEVSWQAPSGAASFSGDVADSAFTPPWPGSYRVRVSARGRDEGQEHYEFVVWSSPLADPVALKLSDRLGHALRGEPAPPVVVLPEAPYHWVESSSLSEAATVTFVAGRSSSEVLQAFGADESAATPLLEFYDRDYQNINPWVCVLDVPGGCIAVEPNGYQGSYSPVLRAASSPDTRAASMYWNVNSLRRFSLARNGSMLASFELGLESTDSPEALELLADLDLDGIHLNAAGLLAASRFTGLSLTSEDISRIESADVAYPILPLLPELYLEERLPDRSRRWPGHGPLGADTDALAALPDSDLRNLAWWAASFAAEHSALSAHPAVTASLAARSLTTDAALLARRSQLYEQGQHHWLWMSLHRATNPDPLAAAIGSLDAARYAVAGHAAELLSQAALRISSQRE